MFTTRILLSDDHAMFRAGLRMLLNASMPNAEVIEAGSLGEAMHGTPQMPDAVLLDIKLPGLNGVDGIALLRRKWPQVPVIMLSSQDEPATMHLALARGASGFISKADTADKIVVLLDHALRGEITAQETQEAHSGDDSGAPPHLTTRQCEVLDLLCQGLSNK